MVIDWHNISGSWICGAHFRMPPARRGRPARQQSTNRQTRAQTAAATVSFAPPPECTVREDFEDCASLQALVGDAQTAAPLSAWEHSMERRVAASENMLQEIHSVVLELRPAAAVIGDSSAIRRPVARDPATSSSAAVVLLKWPRQLQSIGELPCRCSNRGCSTQSSRSMLMLPPPGHKLLNCVRQVILSQCPCRGTRGTSSNPALLPPSHSMPVSLMRFGQRFGRENSLTSPSYLSRH